MREPQPRVTEKVASHAPESTEKKKNRPSQQASVPKFFRRKICHSFPGVNYTSTGNSPMHPRVLHKKYISKMIKTASRSSLHVSTNHPTHLSPMDCCFPPPRSFLVSPSLSPAVSFALSRPRPSLLSSKPAPVFGILAQIDTTSSSSISSKGAVFSLAPTLQTSAPAHHLTPMEVLGIPRDDRLERDDSPIEKLSDDLVSYILSFLQGDLTTARQVCLVSRRFNAVAMSTTSLWAEAALRPPSIRYIASSLQTGQSDVLSSQITPATMALSPMPGLLPSAAERGNSNARSGSVFTPCTYSPLEPPPRRPTSTEIPSPILLQDFVRQGAELYCAGVLSYVQKHRVSDLSLAAAGVFEGDIVRAVSRSSLWFLFRFVFISFMSLLSVLDYSCIFLLDIRSLNTKKTLLMPSSIIFLDDMFYLNEFTFQRG